LSPTESGLRGREVLLSALREAEEVVALLEIYIYEAPLGTGVGELFEAAVAVFAVIDIRLFEAPPDVEKLRLASLAGVGLSRRSQGS